MRLWGKEKVVDGITFIPSIGKFHFNPENTEFLIIDVYRLTKEGNLKVTDILLQSLKKEYIGKSYATW